MSVCPDFVALITEYGAGSGLPVDGHTASVGLEFECRDRIVRILADIHDEHRFCIEVDVSGVSIDESPSVTQSLLLMHRFNDHARIVDGWLASIDLDDMLVLSRSQVIDGVGVQELDRLIEAALDTADMVEKIWNLPTSSEVASEFLNSSRIFG